MNLFKLKRKILLSFILPIPYSKCKIFALTQSGFDIGENVYIGHGFSIAIGYADKSIVLKIGDRSSIAPNVTVVLVSHPNYSRLNGIVNKPKRQIVIEDDCWIGAGVIIMPGITIGECSIVGAGSIVTKDIPSYTIVAGNPARIIKTIDKSLL